MAEEVKIDDLAVLVLDVCKRRGWSLHWESRSAHLHHESTELMEAVRGKHGNVLEEAGDVLFVLMSITETRGIRFSEVVAQVQRKAEDLMIRPRYIGEEHETGDAPLWPTT